MENTKKAIKHFECMKSDAVAVLDSGFGTNPNESDIVYKNRKLYAELAINALEKQILKKPMNVEKTRYDWTVGICPVCNVGVSSRYNFCQGCGQALDWREQQIEKGGAE